MERQYDKNQYEWMEYSAIKRNKLYNKIEELQKQA